MAFWIRGGCGNNFLAKNVNVEKNGGIWKVSRIKRMQCKPF